MSLGCTVDRRQRAQRLREHVLQDDRVTDADVIAPADHHTDRWAVEAQLGERAGGFPSDILFCLGFPVGIRDVSPQGDHYRAVLCL